MKYFLDIRPCEGEARRIELGPGASLLLGRGSAADVQIHDPEISRKHFRLEHRSEGVVLVDLGSHNGTYVNGEKVEGSRSLTPGDRIEIGKTAVVLAGGDSGGACAPERAHFCLSCGRESAAQCRRCGPSFVAPDNAVPGYRIEKRLGAGGMGVVFKASRVEDGIPVAIKVMAFAGDPPEGNLQRFIRESKIPAKLVHENIVAVLGSGGLRLRVAPSALEGGERLCKAGFIVLEYVEGRDLEKAVREEGPLSVAEAVRIGCCVADALTVAGGEGIVHRDIKPQNIMLTPDGTVKVMDFGLAKSFEEAGLSGVTSAGAAMGTPQFMPPEQIEDALYADHRADIYALGATLFFILTGRTPFTGKNVREVLENVVNEDPPKLKDVLPGVPKALSRIVNKCLKKDPAKRYQTADHLWEELTKVMDEAG